MQAPAPANAHANLWRKFGVRSSAIKVSVLQTYQRREEPGEAQKTFERTSDGDGCVQITTELAIQLLKGLKPASKNQARAIEWLLTCPATLVRFVAFVMDPLQQQRYEEDLDKDPEDSTEAMSNWLGRLGCNMAPGAAMDITSSTLTQISEMLLSKLSPGKLGRGLEWLAKRSSIRAGVVGLIVLLAVNAVAAGWNMISSGQPIHTMELASAICNITIDTIGVALGTAASTLVACLGGVAAFLVGSVVAWGFVLAAHELWTASNIPRLFSCKDVCAGVKMALGLAPISSHTPSWDMDMALQTAVHEHACDMTCPITMNVCVEPCSLQGHLFERRALEAWVKEHHTNPNKRAPAYLPEIKVCQQMRDLVMEFSQEYGLHVI